MPETYRLSIRSVGVVLLGEAYSCYQHTVSSACFVFIDLWRSKQIFVHLLNKFAVESNIHGILKEKAQCIFPP